MTDKVAKDELYKQKKKELYKQKKKDRIAAVKAISLNVENISSITLDLLDLYIKLRDKVPGLADDELAFSYSFKTGETKGKNDRKLATLEARKLTVDELRTYLTTASIVLDEDIEKLKTSYKRDIENHINPFAVPKYFDKKFIDYARSILSSEALEIDATLYSNLLTNGVMSVMLAKAIIYAGVQATFQDVDGKRTYGRTKKLSSSIGTELLDKTLGEGRFQYRSIGTLVATLIVKVNGKSKEVPEKQLEEFQLLTDTLFNEHFRKPPKENEEDADNEIDEIDE